MGKKPKAPTTCVHRVLAQGSTAQVQVCQHCGTLALNLGAVTLRFHAAALESLWNTVGEALMALHAETKSDAVALVNAPSRGTA